MAQAILSKWVAFAPLCVAFPFRPALLDQRRLCCGGLLMKMPYVHSAAARVWRLERALSRGFVEKWSDEKTHVAVPAHLASRVRTMYKSAELHHKHCEVVGKPI